MRGSIGKFEAALGVVGILTLAITVSLITGWNPLPKVAGWVGQTTALSRPEAVWVQRVGDQPTAATVADRAVVVVSDNYVEARHLKSGDLLWSRKAAWAGVAGADATAVVIVGKPGKGYDVIGPNDGAVRWNDPDAIGVWPFRDTMLAWTCSGNSDCTVAERALSDGRVRWKATLPGAGRDLAGFNRPLSRSRELAASYVDALRATPGLIPSLLGFPMERKLQVVDSGTGRRLPEVSPGGNTRAVVLDGRVLRTTAVRQGASCRYTVEATDPSTGKVMWSRDGYDLGTASGAGCEQRRDPGGCDTVLLATRGDNRAVLLAVREGRELWVGASGEEVLATDGRYAAVRGAEHKEIKAVELEKGTVVWSHAAAERAEVAVTRTAVIVTDPNAGRLLAYDPTSGRTLIDVATTASLLGVAPGGLIVHRGRNVGYLPFGTRAG